MRFDKKQISASTRKINITNKKKHRKVVHRNTDRQMYQQSIVPEIQPYYRPKRLSIWICRYTLDSLSTTTSMSNSGCWNCIITSFSLQYTSAEIFDNRLTRTDTTEHAVYDKKRRKKNNPEHFKEEYIDGIVANFNKISYCLEIRNKFSSKGIKRSFGLALFVLISTGLL